MKTRLHLSILISLFLTGIVVNVQGQEQQGLWKFDDSSDLTKAEIGLALEVVGSQTSVYGPYTGNEATELGLEDYLIMTHGMSANGGGTMVNEWSLQIDFSVPEISKWHTFFQTDPTNGGDGDCFTHSTNNTIGTAISLYSTNAIEADTWYRMLVTAKNQEFYRIYVDGELWVETSDYTHPNMQLDNRFSLQPTLLMFADNDGDDHPIYCSELAVWDVALTAAEVADLGDAFSGYTNLSELKTTNSNDLGQNYPNPFSYSTTFPYQIRETGNVSFRIFDMTGKEVIALQEGVKLPGNYEVTLNSDKLKKGIYYIQMTANKSTAARKIIVY